MLRAANAGAILRFTCASRAVQRRWCRQPTDQDGQPYTSVHFRLTPNSHPLGKVKREWNNPTQNHVWEPEELEKKLKGERVRPVHFPPETLLDRLTFYAVRFCYHAFNILTGFNKADPSTKSLVYRLIVLESIAGCPGMVAAGVRHFRSLRSLHRDGGWIHTLLEEAENERMHLLVFMNMFTPGILTRGAVIALQYIVVSSLLAVYVVHPKTVHRFVGYLEETAVQTYLSVIQHLENPNSQVHKEWSKLPAPEIAKSYWRLPEGSTFLDVVKQIAADEMHHRDVNHEFANIKQTDFNPHVHTHAADADVAADYRKATKKPLDP